MNEESKRQAEHMAQLSKEFGKLQSEYEQLVKERTDDKELTRAFVKGLAAERSDLIARVVRLELRALALGFNIGESMGGEQGDR